MDKSKVARVSDELIRVDCECGRVHELTEDEKGELQIKSNEPPAPEKPRVRFFAKK